MISLDRNYREVINLLFVLLEYTWNWENFALSRKFSFQRKRLKTFDRTRNMNVVDSSECRALSRICFEPWKLRWMVEKLQKKKKKKKKNGKKGDIDRGKKCKINGCRSREHGWVCRLTESRSFVTRFGVAVIGSWWLQVTFPSERRYSRRSTNGSGVVLAARVTAGILRSLARWGARGTRRESSRGERNKSEIYPNGCNETLMLVRANACIV